MTYFPNMQVTGDDLSVSFDITPMVHDLTRQVIRRIEEGAVGEVVAYLAENGHLADVIRKGKAEGRAEALTKARATLDRITPNGLISKADVLADLDLWADRATRGIQPNGNPYTEKS